MLLKSYFPQVAFGLSGFQSNISRQMRKTKTSKVQQRRLGLEGGAVAVAGDRGLE